jgi:predicted acetyltransferase
METGKEYEILNTNLQPFFWRKVKNIIRQNKKSALEEFLFGYDNVREQVNTSTTERSSTLLEEMKDKSQNLQNQVTLFQQKVINLEAKLDNSKYSVSTSQINLLLSGTLKASNETKLFHREISLKENNGSYLAQNGSQANFEVKKIQTLDSEIFSEADKDPLKTSEASQHDNR